MNYTFSISEAERQVLAESFAILARKLSTCTPVIDAVSGTDQARAVLAPPQAASPSTAPPAVAQSPAPIELRDRWAKDRKGKEAPHPEGSEAIDVHLWKTKQAEKYLRVTWQAAQGYADANCFDSDLWPWLINQTGKNTRLYITRNGKYTNVCGVRA